MPRIDVGLSLVHALDPAAFAADRLGFEPDPWQAQVLRSPARQVILCCCRQAGKSTVTSIVALHCALYEAPALVLVVSPSLRQSRELFAKVMSWLRALQPAEVLEADNRLSTVLANGSRIVSLPGDPKTVRGFSAPRLVVADEAAFVSDELFTAIRPMLAVSEGRLILMSTPNGRRGVFFETWEHGGEEWHRIKIPASQCPRISPEFLEQERRALGPLLYSQEFENCFIDAATSAFSSEMIELALADDFEPFLRAA